MTAGTCCDGLSAVAVLKGLLDGGISSGCRDGLSEEDLMIGGVEVGGLGFVLDGNVTSATNCREEGDLDLESSPLVGRELVRFIV